jgi:pimeloyl-ACP methyl ester carboxylesterase
MDGMAGRRAGPRTGLAGHRPDALFISTGHKAMKNMLLVVLICTALSAAMAQTSTGTSPSATAPAGQAQTTADSAPISPSTPVTDDWNGYTRHTFQFEGRTCYIVDPKWDATGKPWLWRARFWGHRPEVDLALLAQGYHLVYMDVIEMLGNQEAVGHWNDFYKLLTTTYHLNRKTEMEGMSRGSMYVYAWAEQNPDKVAAIYADAPLCSIRSLLALHDGQPDPARWKMAVDAFGFHDVNEALAYRGSPIDNLAPLAKAGVPLLHVVGDADTVVPVEENTRIMEQRYKALGGTIQVIVKPGVGHVHGLDDPMPIIEFLLAHRPTA